VSQVAESITSILDLDQVLERTVELINEAFGYYHVAIMLVDEQANVLTFGAHAGGYSGQIPGDFRQGLEEGMIGWSACHGETVLANDVAQEPRYIPAFLTETMSELSIPLKYRDRVIGVLDLQSRERNAFNEHDVLAMEVLAGHAATAIENARLYQQAQLDIKERRRAEEALRRRAEELAALQDTVLDITARRDLSTLLETTIRRAASLLNAPSGGLYLCDRDQKETRCVVSYNTLGDYTGTVLEYGEGAAGTVAQTGKPLIIDDYRTWDARAAVFEEEQPFTAVVSAPMIWQEEAIGVIHVLDRAEERRFTETDLDLLSLFANHAAIAVENARLLEVADQRVAELQAVRQASLQLTSTLELEPVLKTILQSALELVSADDAHVFLYDNDQLEFGAALWNGEHQQEPYDSVRPHGLTYTVARTGERVVVSDAMSDPLFADRKWEGAIVGLPLTVGAEVQGVMNIAYERPHRFSDDELRVLELLADQAALAIRNARLYNETRGSALEQETLREAALSLTTALERDEVVERILAQLQRVVPYDTASVQLLQGDQLELVGGRGFPNLEELLGVTFDCNAKDNPNREVVLTRKPIILEDAAKVYEEFRREPHAQAVIRSWLGVPMLVGDRLIGMIALDKREPGFYGQEHAGLAEAFAAQAGVAIENAQLHQETVRQLAQTEVLREMMLAAASTLDFDQVLDRTIDVLEDAMGIEYLGLMRPDESGRFMIGHPSMLGFARPDGRYRFPIDQCVSGQVYQAGEPMILSDIRQAEVYAAADEDVRSEMAVPVRIGDKVVAVLSLESSRLDAFNEDDLAFFIAVAGQLGVAMENAQLFEAEREQRQLSEALEEAAAAVSSTLELEQVLDRILEQVERVVAGDTFNIMLIRNEYAYVVRWRGYEKTGVADSISTYSVRLSEYPTLSRMSQTGRPILIPDTAEEDDWVLQEGWEWLRSCVAAPIQIGGTTVGFLNVDSTNPGQFSTDDARRLETFASHAATAIENARLYERLRDHAEMLGERVAERTAQLQAQYARLEAILDSTVNGIVVAGPGGELVLANPIAREWLTQSLSPEEADLLRRTLQDLANRAEENPEQVLELTGLDLQLRAANIEESGVEGATAVVAIHDISHLKALDRMKSRFVSNVSHELRTPIATIKLFAHLMQKQPERWREYLEPLAQEADHQANLVEDILEISRVDAGRLEIKPEPTNLNELIEIVVVNHATRAREDGLTLEHQAVEPGPECLADPQRLIQVLDNLIDNALRYTPEGGKVTIATGEAEAEGRFWATVTIADTGMGIPADELPHVFERFFRGEKPRMMQTSGTGLGLAIVNEIAGLHGGRVTVESEVDAGSAFTVWLPLAQ
jgi:GAF domain-containing protein